MGGLSLRLALGGAGVGERSALVMAALVCLAAWLAALLLSTPRTAFLVTLALVALFDLAALPPRAAPEYDDLDAFYTTEQTLAARVPIPVGLARQPMLTVLVEPGFPPSEATPGFGLGGEINGTLATWQCAFRRGIQRLALPVPAAAVTSGSAFADVQLHLTGAPDQSHYLVAYKSSRQGGFLVALVGAADAQQDTTCGLM